LEKEAIYWVNHLQAECSNNHNAGRPQWQHTLSSAKTLGCQAHALRPFETSSAISFDFAFTFTTTLVVLLGDY
jgi:hypothetical protein